MKLSETDKTLRISSWISFSALALCICGMLTSPALMSIGLFGLVGNGLLITPILRLFRDKSINDQSIRFGHPVFRWLFLTVGAFFIWNLVSYAYTDHDQIFFDNIRIKLPLLLVPLAMVLLPGMQRKQVHGLLWIFMLTVVFISVGTVINFLINYEELTGQISESKPIPVFLGTQHIYFSFIQAFAIFVGIYLFRSGKPLLGKLEKWIALICTVEVFIALHLLTARTGLVAFYIAALILGMSILARRKKYLLLVVSIALLLSTPFAAYFLVPPLKHRVDNTIWDYRNYMQGGDPNYKSIGMRLEAAKAGWHVFQKAPVAGVGIGDMEEAVDLQYAIDGTCLISPNQIMPHNQYLIIGIGLGTVGLLLFAAVLLSPIFLSYYKRNMLFFGFLVVVSVAMMAESVLERQVGVTFFVMAWVITAPLGISTRAESD